jgi:GT2 family glycosyltransferase
MNQPLVYIIILNWNGFKYTSELLESLFHISHSMYKIIIIDNNSRNDEAEKIENLCRGKAHLIKCKENLGFAGGNNVGIKYSLEEKADYILLINNDTIVNPDFLEILVSKYESEKQAGIVAPRINYYDEPQKIWTDGGKISQIRGSGFAYSDKMETEVNSSDKEVSFVSGCCMLIKREVLLNVGLFDENFFLYNEDTDFCKRILNAGYKIFVTPRSKIFHKVNSSTKEKFSLLPLFYTTRNRLYFAKKHFPEKWFFTVMYIVITMFFKCAMWLLIGKHKNIVEVKNAIRDFYSGRMGKTDHTRFA